MDINASAFGLYFISPSVDRPRLMSCFDSDYPGLSGATRNISATASEEIIQHVRHSTGPRCWSAEVNHSLGEANTFPWIGHTAALVPDTTGIAFPVHAERSQSGLVVFFGTNVTPQLGDTIYDIHARCFTLFDAVSRIRPGDTGRAKTMSKRELECLKLTANGYTSEEIARLLKLSVHTANQYLTQSAQKLDAVNRTQAVAKALRLGLID
ncbi:helix-turn-helix transcriptional regulator [Mesorhizobium loti]|nr:helix-turn-helix transcriptional regulator [Mesorhizobium loti]